MVFHDNWRVEYKSPLSPFPQSLCLPHCFSCRLSTLLMETQTRTILLKITITIFFKKTQIFYLQIIFLGHSNKIFLYLKCICNFEQWDFPSVSGWDKQYCFLGSAFLSTGHSACPGHFQGGKGWEDEAAPLKSGLLYLPLPLGLAGITALIEGSVHYSYTVVKTFKGSSDLEVIPYMLCPVILPLYTTVLFMVNSAFTLVLLRLNKSCVPNQMKK